MKKRDIEILSQKAASHQQIVSKEQAETNEMQAAIATLSAQRDAHISTKENLQQQIAETQKQIDAKLAAQKAHSRYLDQQSRFNIPELDFFTSNLALEIEGCGKEDKLRFIYTHIDDRDWQREALFELDISKREYEIPYCRPKLEKEKVERVLDVLNETRDFRGALKGMRVLFVEAMRA